MPGRLAQLVQSTCLTSRGSPLRGVGTKLIAMFKKRDVFSYFDSYIDILNKEHKYSTAEIYICSKNALKSFHSEKLYFRKIDTEFLTGFSNYLKYKKGNSVTTVSLYMRSLRCIFNQAIHNKDTKYYPFCNQSNPYGFRVPTPSKGKRALSDAELGKLTNYVPSEDERLWYDIFMFSYYVGGMNMKDIALLEETNFYNGTVVFTRKKTEHSNSKEISIPLNGKAKEILKRWRTGGKYVFPLVTDKMDGEYKYKAIKRRTKSVNKYMRVICSKLDITLVSTMTARHTVATKLSRSGAPITLISEILGHSSITTTQNYINSFPSLEKEKWLAYL